MIPPILRDILQLAKKLEVIHTQKMEEVIWTMRTLYSLLLLLRHNQEYFLLQSLTLSIHIIVDMIF